MDGRAGARPAELSLRILCGYLGGVEDGLEWVWRLLVGNPAMTIGDFKAFVGHAVPGTIAVWPDGRDVG